MLFEKFKEASLAILPLLGIVFAFHFCIAPLESTLVSQWLVGCALLVTGLSLFLTGAEVGLVPFGQAVGAALPHSRNMTLMLVIVFIFGVAAAYAEFDVHVLGNMAQLASTHNSLRFLSESTIFAIGFFTVVGVARVLVKIPLKILLGVSYTALLLFCWGVLDKELLSLVFANGGGATGPMVVALLMALGLGVTSTAKVSSGNSASFGLVGLISLGVIVISALFFANAQPVEWSSAPLRPAFIPELLPFYLDMVLKNAQILLLVMAPLVGVFFLLQTLFLKLPGIKAKRMALGLVYAGLGMALVITGLVGGLLPAGFFLGELLGDSLSKGAILMVCGLLGIATVCLEPAVWVWSTQVANALGGSMKRLVLVSLLCLSSGLGVVLGMLPILYDVNLWGLLSLGYVLALLLMLLTPRLYTGVAFDAGGVVTGPLCLIFLVNVIMGVCEASFGAVHTPVHAVIASVAFIAMTPLVTVQLFGILFMRTEGQRLTPEQQKRMNVDV